MMRLLCFFCLFFFSVAQAQEGASSERIRIYLDADLSNHSESSMAIQKGIEVAFGEIGNQIDGRKVEFVYLDHRGNVARSKKNYDKFINDASGLAIFSGIHSPPLIRNRDHININKALTLVPWAAGGPITRYPSEENWVFRLSVDDTRAGPVIIDFAMRQKECVAPHLLLESTPWGDSNLKSMSKALLKHGVSNPRVSRFNWNLQPQGARILLRDIIDGGGDCIVLVANAVEGINIAQALIDIDESRQISLVSHWGITGGDFHEKIDAQQRKKIDLSFIQSCFAFTNKEQSALARQVFERLRAQSLGSIENVEDLKSAVGFIHAYDLSRLLIAAINKAGLTGDIEVDRNNIRLALEQLDAPIEGLVKTYQSPFSVFDASKNVNGHEALGAENYCMAQFGEKDQILIIEAASS